MRAGLQNTPPLLAIERSTASPHWVVDICHLHTNLICASWDSIRPSVNVVLHPVPYLVCRVCLYCARLPGVPYLMFSNTIDYTFYGNSFTFSSYCNEDFGVLFSQFVFVNIFRFVSL